jgi:hypothetical protein
LCLCLLKYVAETHAIQIGDGTYWIGFYDAESGLHCIPYLIIDDEGAPM